MSRYDDNKPMREHIKAQSDAEFKFFNLLDSAGIDTAEMQKRLGITRHEFNIIAHAAYGVNDEVLASGVTTETEASRLLMGLFKRA